MSLLIAKLRSMCHAHPSDETLLLLMDKELTWRKRFSVDQHVSMCARCRERCALFERSTLWVEVYSQNCSEANPLCSGSRRKAIFARLNSVLYDTAPGLQKTRRSNPAPQPTLRHVNPISAMSFVFAIAAAAWFMIWLPQRTPNITPNTLLARAESWDAKPDAATNVICQTVRIRASQRMIERTIYRDAQGGRRAKLRKLTYDEAQLSNKLTSADVSWDAPLSAADYHNWHDRHAGGQDRIARVGHHLLALTTTVTDGAVMEESLTVRDSDFHPVERAVKFRDSNTIEIAELSYQALPWSDTTSILFESTNAIGGLQSGMSSIPSFSPLMIFPPVVTARQLDEAELGVRLSLNQLHADSGEQIEVTRDADRVQVKGLVETERRKHELQDQLRLLPHVTVSLSSIERMKAAQSQAADITSVQVASMQTQTTPLETYYLEHGRSSGLLSKLSLELFDSAFTADLESRAIDDLEHRYAGRNDMSLVASATLAELMFNHKQNLLAALRTEKEALAETGVSARGLGIAAPGAGSAAPLVTAAERNLALSKELALGSGDERRSAEEIVAEMVASMSDLYSRAHEARIVPASSMSQNKKK